MQTDAHHSSTAKSTSHQQTKFYNSASFNKQQFKQTNSPFYFLAFSITFHDISCASLHNDFVELAKMQVNIQGVEHDLRRIEQIDSRVYNKMGVPVVWLPFLCSWIINEFENLGKRGILRVTCPRDNMEFKYFSSPVTVSGKI